MRQSDEPEFLSDQFDTMTMCRAIENGSCSRICSQPHNFTDAFSNICRNEKMGAVGF